MTNTLLFEWVSKYREKLENLGFEVLVEKQHIGGSQSVKIYHPKVVGSICHWPNDRFEFQLNAKVTGDVIIIDEFVALNREELADHFFDMVEKFQL